MNCFASEVLTSEGFLFAVFQGFTTRIITIFILTILCSYFFRFYFIFILMLIDFRFYPKGAVSGTHPHTSASATSVSYVCLNSNLNSHSSCVLYCNCVVRLVVVVVGLVVCCNDSKK